MATVRPANAEDLSRLAELFLAYRGFYGVSATLDECRKFLGARLSRGDSIILVADLPGPDAFEVAGFAQLYPTFSSLRASTALILNDLFVASEFRRRGVGAALLEAVRQLATARGIPSVALATGKANSAARALYEAHGYVLAAEFDMYELNVDP